MTQNFKGDALELEMQAAGAPPFDICSSALDEFYDGCFDASDFLLSLYDSARMPFGDRIPRESFVAFFKQALEKFPVTGSYESYIFIIQVIFGAGSTIEFDTPVEGKVVMTVNATAEIESEFQAREFSAGTYSYFDMETMDGDTILFIGISGIDSEPKLKQLLSELIPGGISPTITLT